MSNLTQRVLVAIIGVPAILILTVLGGWWFFLFVQVVAVLGLNEFFSMASQKGCRPNRALGLGATLAIGFMLFFIDAAPFVFLGEMRFFLIVAIVMFLALATLIVELWRDKPQAIANVSITGFGVMYVAFCLDSLLGIRSLFAAPWIDVQAFTALNGAELELAKERWAYMIVLCTIVAIWICDTAAYFVGLSIGKHKLFPRISPKKSWEGAIGGFLFSGLGFALMAHFWLPVIPTVHAIILGILIGIIGQLGDLSESLLKRDAGIKDSSNIIPGHGGILDRFDSILFVAPLVFIYLNILWYK